ncbi:homoserine kinase [Cryptosporangium phraense]|uniref:homoserine kinase n=1 Tax=Cryptosporangium phraense TaxID=2593070 RepID=UPI00197AC078|nr:homoserine kinase [Cryptosporangium phraense]
MTFVSSPVAVRPPATTANIGPGYDALGAALTLFDEIELAVTGGGLEVELTGEGADELPTDERHLLVRAARAAFDRLGGQPAGLRLRCLNRIPQARGMGSSSAAVVGGIVAARGLVDGGAELMTDADALALAAEIEGHPDNVAPCLLGGVTIAWADDVTGLARAARMEPAADLRPVICVPKTRGYTAASRGLLPAEVPHAEAAANAGRAALLVRALTAQPDLLLPATRDWLHQDYRRASMPQSLDLVDALRADGVAAVVSGAGPTVLAFAPVENVEAIATKVAGSATFEIVAVDVSSVGAVAIRL